MLRKYLILTILISTTFGVYGQQTNSNRVQVGYNINQFQDDFGVGIHVVSPYFLYQKVAVRGGFNLQWFEHIDDGQTTWTPYQNIQLGLRSRSLISGTNIFIYGEGGVVGIIPNPKFSTGSFELGGYGLFGFEFKPAPRFGYFVELGGVGTGANADKIETSPIYSNGFVTSVGFRIGL